MSCCRSFSNGSPSCTYPIGPPVVIRNLAVERMAESIEISCRYAHHGCRSMIKLSEREEHENELCEHRPIHCPVPGHQDHEAPRISMAEHLFSRHDAKLVEASEATRSASFKMKLSDEFVMVQSKDKWLLLHCVTLRPVGARLYCMSFGRSKSVEHVRATEVAYRLTVEPVKQNTEDRPVVYDMKSVAVDYSCTQLSMLRLEANLKPS